VNGKTPTNTGLSKVAVLNAFPQGFGVGTYGASLARAVSHGGLCISLRLSPSSPAGLYPGESVDSPLNSLPSGGIRVIEFARRAANLEYQHILYRRAFRRVRDFVQPDGVIHYSDPAISPIDGPNEVVTIHDLTALSSTRSIRDEYSRFVRRNLERFRTFPTIVADTNTAARQVRLEGFGKRVVVVYPPVPQGLFPVAARQRVRESLGLPENRRLVLSVSSLSPRKNLGVVSKTLELLGEEYKLVRIGPPLANSITFERAPQAIVNLLYNACDALLFPSLEEGFGYPLIEAFATGLPVVCSDIPVLREVAGGAAVLVDPAPPDCAAGVRLAIERHDEYQSKGFSRSSEFSFEAFESRLSAVYGLT
jgi:glycosyltransferase involved in cell wall biosynthesis